MKNISVIGAGTMGNGIAHVFAMHGFAVQLIDISQPSLDKAMTTIAKNLDRMVSKERIALSDKDETLTRITTTTDMVAGLQDADLVVRLRLDHRK